MGRFLGRESVVLVTRSPLTFFLSLPRAHAIFTPERARLRLRVGGLTVEAQGESFCASMRHSSRRWVAGTALRGRTSGHDGRTLPADRDRRAWSHVHSRMPNERMVLPLLENAGLTRLHRGLRIRRVELLGDLGSGWGSSSGSFDGGSMVSGGHGGGGGGSGGGSGDGVRSAGGGLGYLDEDSLVTCRCIPGLRLRGGAGVAGGRAGRVSVPAESSNKKRRGVASTRQQHWQ